MLRALNDYVLVEPINVAMSPGGLHIPEPAQKEYNFQGKVIDIAPSVKIPLKLGDVVAYSRQTGWHLKYKDREVLAIHEGDLIAVQEADEDEEAAPDAE